MVMNIQRGQRGNALAAESAQERSTRAAPDEGFADPFQAEVTLLRGDARALSEQAHPLLAAGRLDDAAALIDRLSREHPTFPDTWLLTGRLQYLRKKYGPAEQSLRRFLDLSPQSTQGLFQLGSVLLTESRFVEAADVFGQATRLKPDFGPAYFNQGIALARAERKPEAVAAFKHSVRHNPERVQSYLFLADLELQLGQTQDALTHLNQAEAIEPANAHLRSLRERATRLTPH
jgi:protein O-GlcNAc transferase